MINLDICVSEIRTIVTSSRLLIDLKRFILLIEKPTREKVFKGFEPQQTLETCPICEIFMIHDLLSNFGDCV
jgi:hypothetical protein